MSDGDGAPQPKKLLSFEEPAGDLGGDFGSGLLRLEWLARLDALSGGLSRVGEPVCCCCEIGFE